MKSFFSKIFHLPVYIHLLAVIAVLVAAVYFTLKYIDVYTNHNQAVIVPDVRGLQVDVAAPLLEQYMLRYEVIDSIFSKEFEPGAIVELLPEADARVKKNRIIYITLNAKTEETALVPNVADLSYRQAYSDLITSGFKFVEEKYVSGEYRNLTIGVEYQGKLVSSGARLPLTAKLFLVVSDGNIEPQQIRTINEDDVDENDKDWF